MGTWTMTDGRLSEKHVKVLQYIASGGSRGRTRTEIEEQGHGSLGKVLGPKYHEDVGSYEMKYGKRSLISLGLVRAEVEIVGVSEKVRYVLTDLGEKAAEFYRVQGRGDYDHVPGDVLDPVVIQMRKSRVYGFERWTTEDMTELRKGLPVEYHKVTLEDVRRQMINRRKQGYYGDEEKIRFNKKFSHLKRLVMDYWGEKIELDEVVDFIKNKGDRVGESESS